MQTVNFQCGHCGNLMAVEEHFLGQQVQCPHCQQVVQTSLPTCPESVPPPAELSAGVTFAPPPPTAEEGISIAAEKAGDALSGGAAVQDITTPPSGQALARRPLEELPDQTPVEAAGTSAASEPLLSSEAIQAGVTPPGSSDVLSFKAAAPSDVPPFPAPDGEFQSQVAGDSGTSLARETFSAAIPRRAAQQGMRSGVFIALVLIPLISYAVLATIAVVILLLRPQGDPLEFLPDREGDLKGAKRQKQSSASYERVSPDRPLPNKLKIALGQSIRIGDLEVTPQKVELRRVTIRHPGFPAEPGIDASLVLHLLLRNISRDVVFSPTDPFFDRRWKGARYGNKPYTFLDIGEYRFYGGPLTWDPRRQPGQSETLEGQQHKTLLPGERLATLVCTDPDHHVGRVLAKFHGDLIWRVHLRRGLVQVGDREYPATAVVGVQFKDTDILKPAT